MRGRRGFSLVETVVAFGLFLVVAAVVSWSLSSAFASKASTGARENLGAALQANLAQVASVPYADLLAGTFTVPEPCDEEQGAGLAGTSCVSVGGQEVTVGYRFTGPGDSGVCPEQSLAARDVVAEHGYFQVQACVLSSGSSAFAGQVTSRPAVPAQTRTVNPPNPGALPEGRRVVVHVEGAVAELGERPVLLVWSGDPTKVVATGTVAGGQVRFDVPAVSEAPVCTSVNPCAVALSTANPSTRTTASADAAVLDVVDRAGVNAAVVVGDGATAQVRVALALSDQGAAS